MNTLFPLPALRQQLHSNPFVRLLVPFAGGICSALPETGISPEQDPPTGTPALFGALLAFACFASLLLFGGKEFPFIRRRFLFREKSSFFGGRRILSGTKRRPGGMTCYPDRTKHDPAGTRQHKHPGQKWITGGLALLFLFFTGRFLALQSIEIGDRGHFSRHSFSHLHVRVSGLPEEKGTFIRVPAEVLHGVKAGKFYKSSGHLLLYLRPPEKGKGVNPPAQPGGSGGMHSGLRYGVEMLIRARYRPVDAPRYPAGFDYRRYLARRNIFHQAFLYPGEWRLTGSRSGSFPRRVAADLQQKCIGVYSRSFRDEGTAALLSALVLGYRAELDPSIEAAFADTGTIHILSVSGMHVAMLYWLVALFLRPLSCLPGGKGIATVSACTVVAAYAFLTGLSPPVCRATWMILLYALAGMLAKEREAMNLLAFSAWVLLASRPLVLADVGFQLSYLATGGLVYFYPRIHGMWRPENFLLRHIWSLTSVSLAAQLSTFPLAVYYFHRFPVFFLASNLVVIPLCTLLLYGGVILLPLSLSEGAASLLAQGLSALTEWTVAALQFFSDLPGAVLEGLWIQPYDVILLYAVIFSLAALLSACAYGRPGLTGWLKVSLCAGILLCFSSTLENYRAFRQRLLLVFSTGKEISAAFVQGRSALLLTGLTVDSSAYRYTAGPFLDSVGVRNKRFLSREEDFGTPFFSKKGHRIRFFHMGFMLPAKPPVPGDRAGRGQPSAAFSTALLLIAENPYLQTSGSQASLKAFLVVSGTDRSHREKQLRERCRREGIGFYSLEESGYLLVSCRE